MKTLLLLVFLAGISAAVADDNLLQNGDFSRGIAHWEGDCHTPDSDVVDLSSNPTGNSSGVIVKLRHGDWSKMSQDFDGKVGEYLLTLTYSVSPDFKFSTRADDYVNTPAKIGLTAFLAFNTAPGEWVLFVTDMGAGHCSYWTISPKTNAPGVQKITTRVNLDSGDSAKKGFYLAFPPGEGFVTLQGITLVPYKQ